MPLFLANVLFMIRAAVLGKIYVSKQRCSICEKSRQHRQMLKFTANEPITDSPKKYSR